MTHAWIWKNMHALCTGMRELYSYTHHITIKTMSKVTTMSTNNYFAYKILLGTLQGLKYVAFTIESTDWGTALGSPQFGIAQNIHHRLRVHLRTDDFGTEPLYGCFCDRPYVCVCVCVFSN